jgi:hypothetical protein
VSTVHSTSRAAMQQRGSRLALWAAVRGGALWGSSSAGLLRHSSAVVQPGQAAAPLAEECFGQVAHAFVTSGLPVLSAQHCCRDVAATAVLPLLWPTCACLHRGCRHGVFALHGVEVSRRSILCNWCLTCDSWLVSLQGCVMLIADPHTRAIPCSSRVLSWLN